MKFNLTLAFLLVFGFSQAQTITTVVPNKGKVGKTLEVVISGDQTHFGQGTSAINTSVWLSQATSTTAPNIIFPTKVKSATSAGPTEITATFSFDLKAPMGDYHVNTINGVDGLLTKSFGFNLNDNPVGINEFNEKYQLSVYPNPTIDQLTLKMNLSKQAEVSVFIYDISGKELKATKQQTALAGQYLLNLDAEVNKLESGIYLMQVKVDNDVMIQPIVKNN